MENVLLGMLMKKPDTGYDIKKKMEVSTKYFFSSSQGSINPAFKRLERKGFVTSEEVITNNRLKKIYTITDSGRVSFKEWLGSEIKVSKVKNDMLLRLFFFPYVTQQERIDLLERYLAQLGAHIIEMENVGKIPSVRKSINEYQKATLEFGIGYYKFTYDWYNEYLINLKKGNINEI